MANQEERQVVGRKLRMLLILDAVLVLVVCSLFLIRTVSDHIRRRSFPYDRGPIVGEARKDAASKGLAIQDIRLYPPRQIPGSGAWFVEIAQRDLREEKRLRTVIEYFRMKGEMPRKLLHLQDGATVNLLFYSEDDPDGFLLFDRQVLIQEAEIPGDPKAPQDYILYRVVLEDTNGDGRLNQEDCASLWISDLDGRGLEGITPDSLAVEMFSRSEDFRQVYLAVWIDPGDPSIPREHWDQGLYVYDVDRKKLDAIPIDRDLFEKARSLLQR